MYRFRSLLLLITLLLAACGGAPPPPDVPAFPGAEPLAPADAPQLAQALVGSFTLTLGGERAASAVQLFRVPSDTRWDAVKQHYTAPLEAAGWQPEPSILTEGDTFSYIGWTNGGRLFAVGLVEDTLGEGAYLTTATVTR